MLALLADTEVFWYTYFFELIVEAQPAESWKIPMRKSVMDGFV